MTTIAEVKRRMLEYLAQRPEGMCLMDFVRELDLCNSTVRSAMEKLVDGRLAIAHIYAGHSNHRGRNFCTVYITLPENAENPLFVNRTLPWCEVHTIYNSSTAGLTLYDMRKQCKAEVSRRDLDRQLEIVEYVKANPGVNRKKLKEVFGGDLVEYSARQCVSRHAIYYFRHKYYAWDPRLEEGA